MKFTTIEEVKKRAEDLSEEHKVVVHPMTFKGDGEDDLVVGFVKEPGFLIKARAMDKMYGGMSFTAGMEIMDACMIKEDTDPRILSALPANDTYKLGAVKFCGELVRYRIDITEKKN